MYAEGTRAQSGRCRRPSAVPAGVAMLLVRILDIYSLILFVSVILSWTGLPYDHPVVRVSRALTEPLLRPIRRVLPTIGGFDFSPMLLLITIGFVRRMLRR
jgi:YggT family protein